MLIFDAVMKIYRKKFPKLQPSNRPNDEKNDPGLAIRWPF